MTHYFMENDENDKAFYASLKLRDLIQDNALATYPLKALPLLTLLMSAPHRLYKSGFEELCALLGYKPEKFYEEIK